MMQSTMIEAGVDASAPGGVDHGVPGHGADMPGPLTLHLDRDALVANWRWLARHGAGAACGAAVKADGYGLGADRVVETLAGAGCRDVFVATWAEAAAIAHHASAVSIAVLHGVRDADMAVAAASPARPVLNSMQQVQRWKAAFPGRPCDVMIDTGMNRLGLSPGDATSGHLDGLAIDTLHSHLSSADDDPAESRAQRLAFEAACTAIACRRRAIANSAGICLGSDYALDLTRPGLALYGGIPRSEAAGHIRPVAVIAADVLQVRDVGAGEAVGYNRTWTAPRDSRLAVVNLGYADGYARALSSIGRCWFDGQARDIVGRVSMDLVTVDVTGTAVGESDAMLVPVDPPLLAAAMGRSQYEVLTGLGTRFRRP